MSKKTYTERFIELCKLLKLHFGVKYKDISKTIGISEMKRKNIFGGQSSPEPGMIEALYKAYPKLITIAPKENLSNSLGKVGDIQKEVDQIKEKIRHLEKLVEQNDEKELIYLKLLNSFIDFGKDYEGDDDLKQSLKEFRELMEVKKNELKNKK